MSHRPIIDAGPGLNFLSINKERLLIGVLGKLSAPEIVETEVLRKSRDDERFRRAAKVWRKMTPTYMQILPDNYTPELAAAVQRIAHQPMEERVKRRKDLGETMVIAHAAVAAETGDAVTVLIDDGEGARIAASESRRLERLRESGRAVGSIHLVDTETVLRTAVARGFIADRSELRLVYKRLRELDDGLPPIESTGLLSATD
ncbi:hypothetical protein IDM40_22025 [Nocardiopsis sp. HNM0947]|uniref:PIN domain-containing protein n=1 Tax=Nocardiopsis coralli TaxID=2772213 RepID=A0ABR9PBZ0_9ACTN|nr:hypothetical protein [Nocardiopsis coralli]MBE3001348.1 hypothetical protein [Nocardiopsis coralli]